MNTKIDYFLNYFNKKFFSIVFRMQQNYAYKDLIKSNGNVEKFGNKWKQNGQSI